MSSTKFKMTEVARPDKVEFKAQLCYKLLRKSAKGPTRERTSDAGFDVYACFFPSFEENNGLQKDKRVWTGGKMSKLCSIVDSQVDPHLKCPIIDSQVKYHLKLSPGTRGVIPTGLSVSCPEDTVFQVWPRSGLAVKNGISVMAGLIDSGFRGEVCIVLLNDSDQDMVIEEGMKIAQLVPVKLNVSEFVEVEGLPDSTRGSSGFGSSGLYAPEGSVETMTE